MHMHTRWQAYCAKIHASDENSVVFEQLHNGYAAKNRYYHNWQHIRECLDLLSLYAATPDTSLDQIEFALWFHDVIYKARSSSNEEDSAALAIHCAQSLGAFADVHDHIRDLIMATKVHKAVGDPAKDIIVDIDLAILGASSGRFDEYEVAIAREYAWVPKVIFRKKRAEILNDFLQREQIYQTDVMRTAREANARVNLQRALDALS